MSNLPMSYSLQKLSAIRDYSRHLSRILLVQYGLQQQYLPAQVKQMIQKYGCSTAYDRYGLAMYCHQSDFMNFLRSTGESWNYVDLRQEISKCLSLPYNTFDASDMIEFGTNSSHIGNDGDEHAAIRDYSLYVGRILRGRYGLQNQYPPGQVKQTIQQYGYQTDNDCYALAMYCDQADFIDFHRSIGESCNYSEMRYEIRDCLSLHSNAFDISDLMSLSRSYDSGNEIYYRSSESNNAGSYEGIYDSSSSNHHLDGSQSTGDC
jgi:hypothetical protein